MDYKPLYDLPLTNLFTTDIVETVTLTPRNGTGSTAKAIVSEKTYNLETSVDGELEVGSAKFTLQTTTAVAGFGRSPAIGDLIRYDSIDYTICDIRGDDITVTLLAYNTDNRSQMNPRGRLVR